MLARADLVIPIAAVALVAIIRDDQQAGSVQRLWGSHLLRSSVGPG